MNWFRNLKSNKSAQKVFIILLVGFSLIQVAGIFTVNLYSVRSQHAFTVRELQEQLIRTVALIDELPPEIISKNSSLLTGSILHDIHFVPGPVMNASTIQSHTPEALKQFALHHYHSFRANLQLSDGQWLILRAVPIRVSFFLYLGLIISELFLLVILCVLCAWVVQRLAIPVAEFEYATKRFGVDLQAPPMAMQGTLEMQAVIHAFNEMQNRIRRLMMDRTQMLAAISHDLRTPITRLQLRIEALKGTPQYEKAEADLQEMQRMISSILSFVRDHTRTEQMERFDLKALLETITNEMEDMGYLVYFDSDVARQPYFGRMLALKRAFTNLIENGVKYGDKVDVHMSVQSNHIKIKIRDYGPGIPDSEMEKVFAPFYRVDPARNFEKSGSGLGLAVAQDIIRAHGGDVHLYNHEDQGLLAIVTL